MKNSNGLTRKELARLHSITDNLTRIESANEHPHDINLHRKQFSLYREAIHLFQDVVARLNESHEDLSGPGSESLLNLAGRAMLELGGEVEPAITSLRDYDHGSHGPFLGISDEGSAVHVIRRASLNSPKMKVLGTAPPIVVGVSHDAERLAAVGEVAVGPDEYQDVRLGSAGSILTSTNVGTRMNLKYYKLRPTIFIPRAKALADAVDDAIAQAQDLLLPFIHTPDKKPRPITILIHFEPGMRYEKRGKILKHLRNAFLSAEFCIPDIHTLGLLVQTDRGGYGVKTAMQSIKIAADNGIPLVAIRGIVLPEAEDKISMPDLLQYFSPRVTGKMMKYAADKGVSIEPKNMLDPDTVARSVWAALQTARNMGLELGKYGLFPLTIPQSDEVMGKIQSWFKNWTAAPAFYVDFPTVGSEKVYETKSIAEGLHEWLDIVASHEIPVVLIDTADKDKGLRLMKDSADDRDGILLPEEIREIDKYAAGLGIKALWAGGIRLRQVFEFGRLGVFGIYVTSSAASMMPVTREYKRDPMIVAVKEPTREGVTATLLLLQTGFLFSRLVESGLSKEAKRLEHTARKFTEEIDSTQTGEQFNESAAELSRLAIEAWRTHYKTIGYPGGR